MSIDKLGIKPWMKLELLKSNSEEEVVLDEKEEKTEVAPEAKPITVSLNEVLDAYNRVIILQNDIEDGEGNNESNIVEVGGIKIDCSSLSPDGFIIGAGGGAKANATKALMSLKGQIKNLYGNEINAVLFEGAYNRALLDAVNNIQWIQEGPNKPAKANVKDLVTDFLTRLTGALGEVKTEDAQPENNNKTELIEKANVEQLYNNLTSPAVSDFKDLFEKVAKSFDKPEVQRKLVEDFLKEHSIIDVTVEDILNGFEEVADKIKNVRGIFAREQAKLIAIEEFANSVLTNHKKGYAELFLKQNPSLNNLTPEELIAMVNETHSEISKIGGGFAAAQAREEALNRLTDTLNSIAFENLNNIIEDNINQDFSDNFTDDSENDKKNPKTKSFDTLVAHKDEFKETLKEIFENDIYAETTIEAFTEREIDTFIDSVITQVVNANPDADEATLVAQVNAQLQEKLATDPLAPMSISQNLLNTDDYLLSDEEKAIKADILNIEQDKDPEAINGDGIDYSVMPHAAVNVAQVSTDWDYMDMDTALNSKNIYGEFSTKTTTANLYKNLEQLKPQLKEMIKAEFEAIGKEFDEAIVDKYLNYFMTEVVREAIQAKYHETLPDLYPNTVLPANATIEDLGKLLTTKVKEELAEGNDSFGTNWANDEIDPLLCATSDYFLSEEERARKLQMENNKAGL